RSSRRDAGRRRAERHAAQEETAADATGPADRILARVEMQQHVASAVLALDEPYRTAVLLRYWEELPPRSIAARLGLPTETVRTRLKRGLSQLRARLDERYGARAPWLLPMPTFTQRGTETAGSAAALAAAAATLFSAVTIMKYPP